MGRTEFAFVCLCIMTIVGIAMVMSTVPAESEMQRAPSDVETVGGGTAMLELFSVFVTVIVAAAGFSLIVTVADSKRYPLSTVAYRRPKPYHDTESVRYTIWGCINCDTTNEPGVRIRYGRETILFGIVLAKTHEGTHYECAGCHLATTGAWRQRATADTPTPLTGTYAGSRDDMVAAVEEATA